MVGDSEEAEPWDEVTPIIGYGDFSGVDYEDIDWVEVVALVVRCVNDQGFPVEVMPPGDGISFEKVPRDQNAAAGDAVYACRAGLSLPEPSPVTDERIAEVYEQLLDVEKCIEREFAIDVPDAPSLEVFIETWRQASPWHPYLYVSPTRFGEVEARCPQP